MSLWKTREDANKALAGELSAQADAIDEGFQLLDEAITRLDHPRSQFSRVCALATAKGRNLALGLYSLILDGLAQESGALLRPFIEALELLTYFRLDPQRVQLAVDGELPKAGKIAEAVSGHFKDLREHLNDNASHFGMSPHSLRHVISLKDLKVRLTQPYIEQSLLTNLATFSMFLEMLVIETFNCSIEAQVPLSDALEARINAFRANNTHLFVSDNASGK